MKDEIIAFCKNNPSIYSLQLIGYDYKTGPKYADPGPITQNRAEIDLKLFEARQKAIFDRENISEGDYVKDKDGNFSRVTVTQWPEDVQIGGHESNAVFIHKSGTGSYSGTCGECIKRSNLRLTGEYKSGAAWIFSNDSAGAGRGVYKQLLFKVYEIIE